MRGIRLLSYHFKTVHLDGLKGTCGGVLVTFMGWSFCVFCEPLPTKQTWKHVPQCDIVPVVGGSDSSSVFQWLYLFHKYSLLTTIFISIFKLTKHIVGNLFYLLLTCPPNYHPPTKLWEGNAFSHVCLSFRSQREGVPMWPLPMMH